VTGHTLYEVGHSEDQETIKKNLELNDSDLIEGMYIVIEDNTVQYIKI